MTTTHPNQHSDTAHPASYVAPLVLCGGGTGGHVYPALAVAEQLRGQRLLYVGSRDGMEAALVARESSLPFYGLPAAALRGRNPLAMARAGLVLGAGVLQARQLLTELRPAAILGTGGYVCVPLFVAARAAGIPTAIYLPDVVPGLAVKALARLATVVACNVEDSAPYFGLQIADCRLQTELLSTDLAQSSIFNLPSAIYVVGYPVRRELWTQNKAACRAAFGLDAEPPALLVYGGSRGARSINRAVEALLPWLLQRAQVIHVCGREGDEGWLRAAAAALPTELRRRYHVYPYLFGDEGHGPTMTRALGAADVTLCRSGASTLAELPAAGLPAVLVPYPYVHQDENADYLARRGAAVKVGDDQLPGAGKPGDGTLEHELGLLLASEAARAEMTRRSRALAQHDAAQRLAELLRGLAARK